MLLHIVEARVNSRGVVLKEISCVLFSSARGTGSGLLNAHCICLDTIEHQQIQNHAPFSLISDSWLSIGQ